MSSPTLQDLTGGEIPFLDLAHFFSYAGARSMAEGFLGYKVKETPEQPLFDARGEPLRDPDKKPIYAQWGWAACLTQRLIECAGLADEKITAKIIHLPIPFWQPVAVQLITADDYAVFAVRSHATRNAIGNALSLAAGFVKKSDEKNGKNIFLGGAEREMEEETGLIWNDVVSRCENLGPSLNHPIQRFHENMAPIGEPERKVVSCCPPIIRMIGARTWLPRDELMARIRPNYESVGFVTLPTAGLCRIADDAREYVFTMFYPSSGLSTLECNGRNLLKQAQTEHALFGMRKSLIELRMALEAKRLIQSPKTWLFKDQAYGLTERTPIDVRANDFEHDGCRGFITKTLEAARCLAA